MIGGPCLVAAASFGTCAPVARVRAAVAAVIAPGRPGRTHRRPRRGPAGTGPRCHPLRPPVRGRTAIAPLRVSARRRSRLRVRFRTGAPVSLPIVDGRRRGSLRVRRDDAGRGLRLSRRGRVPLRSGLRVGRVALAAGAGRLRDVGPVVGLAASVAVAVVRRRRRVRLGRRGRLARWWAASTGLLRVGRIRLASAAVAPRRSRSRCRSRCGTTPGSTTCCPLPLPFDPLCVLAPGRWRPGPGTPRQEHDGDRRRRRQAPLARGLQTLAPRTRSGWKGAT